MEGKRFIVLGGVFIISLSFLCVHIYADSKAKKSERMKQLIQEAEISLSNINKDM
jgi:hypothetical protein